MPRNYIKKTSGPSYTQQDLRRAIEDVQNRNKTYRQAQVFYGVPIAVICQRVSGNRRTAIDCTSRGRKTALSAEVEEIIEKSLISRAEYGYPCDKNELQELVKTYVEMKDIKTPFKNNRPGDDWYFDFLKRHPRLSIKKPEHLQKLRKDARKPDIIYEFYETLETTMTDKNLNSIEKSNFVFNADESGFPSDPSRIRAIGTKGKPLCRVSGGSGRENTTVLACVGADGSFLPPLIVFKGAAVQPRWTSKDAFPGTLYATSNNGWMEEPQFFFWFTKGFIPYVEKIRQENNLPNQSALLIFDGHASHMSVRILEEAINKNIVLVKLPSHLTDKLQPLDKCVFGPIKTAWEKLLIAHGKKKMGTGSGRLTKGEFTELLGIVWANSMKAENIISGFRSTGTFPVDKTKFPVSEFNKFDLEAYLKAKETPILDHQEVETLETDPKLSTSITSPTTAAKGSTEKQNVHSLEDILNQPSTSKQSCASEITELFFQKTEQLNNKGEQVENSNDSTEIQNIHPLKDISNQPSTSKQSYASEIKELFFQKPEQLNNKNEQVKTSNVRLKQRAYGEVLTTEDVMNRMKEAEEKRQSKVKKQKKPDNCKTNAKRQKTMQKKNKIKETEESSNDESDLESQKITEDSDFSNEEDPEDYLEVESCKREDLAIGAFVLVNFIGGKRNTTSFKYVCAIEALEGSDEVQVVGLKSMNDLKQDFFIVETDKSYVKIDQIAGLLPVPLIKNKGTRIFYHFNKKIPVFEQ